MKIKIVLFLVFATSLSLMLSSYRIGAANSGGYDCTGAEGSGTLTNGGVGTVGCSAGSTCHNATTSLNTVVELDSAGTSVTSYVPGGSYTVKISATNGTGNNLPVFGFQLATVLAAHGGDTAAAQAGTWGTALPPHVQKVAGGASGSGLNIPVIEHSDTISAVTGTGGAGTTYGISIPWTAPAAGTGSVKLYGVLNGSSGHDLANQNYYQAATPITITEAVSHVGINELSDRLSGFNVYPTLMSDNVSVAFDLKEASSVNLSLVSMDGKTVKSFMSESLGEGTFKRSFDVNGLSQGVYLMRLQIGNSSVVSKVVKQ